MQEPFVCSLVSGFFLPCRPFDNPAHAGIGRLMRTRRPTLALPHKRRPSRRATPHSPRQGTGTAPTRHTPQQRPTTRGRPPRNTPGNSPFPKPGNRDRAPRGTHPSSGPGRTTRARPPPGTRRATPHSPSQGTGTARHAAHTPAAAQAEQPGRAPPGTRRATAHSQRSRARGARHAAHTPGGSHRRATCGRAATRPT